MNRHQLVVFVVAITATVIFGVILSRPAHAADDETDATQPATAKTEANTDAKATRSDLVGWLKLNRKLREGPVPYAWVSESDAPPSLSNVVTQLEFVADNERYQGVVLSLDQPKANLSQIAALHEAMAKVRKANKKVLVFSEAYDLRTYLLASGADQIVLQRGGTVQLSGLGMEEMYVAGLLEKIGIKADLMQVGKFKGAKDNFTRSSPSEAWNQNINRLLDGLYAHILDTLADGRNVTEAKMEELMRASWSMDAEAAFKAGLIDRLADRNLINVTETAFGNDFAWDQQMGQTQTTQQASGPMALFRMLMDRPDITTSQPTIAVVHARGPIVSGRSSRGEGMFASRTIGSRTMIKALERVRRDDNIKGAIVRIDSPGGSALASEVIWQAMRQTANQKPLFISLGNTAASGGYYIASAGDRIYATPPSIVGSIGVVGGKLAMGGLYDKIGVSVTQRTRGPMGGVFNSAQPFNDQQRETVRASLQRVYDQFIERVRLGRGKRIDDIGQVAQGRIFTGQQAKQNGLIDHLGGLNEVINQLAKKLQLKPGQYELLHLPPPMSLQRFLNATFGAQTNGPTGSPIGQTIQASRQLLGEKRWQAAAPIVTGLMQLRDESALTLMPTAIVLD
jgi:protease-4